MKFERLGQLCAVRSGGTPSRSNTTFFGGLIPWAKIADIEASDGQLSHTEESITDAGLAAIRGRLFPAGTLLFAIYGSIGKMAFCKRPVATNQAILGIEIPSDGVVDARYLFRYLEALRPTFESDGVGVTQKNLSAAYVRNIAVPLPPYTEQRRIAAILDQADVLRRLRRQSLARLSGLRSSLFRHCFHGDNQQAEFAPLADVVAPETIVTYGIVQAGEEYEGGVPYIRTGDLKNGVILTDDLRHTDPAIAAKFERSKVRPGEIVMSIRATVGTTALVPDSLDGANLTQGTARIAPGPRTNGIYLLEYLRSEETQRWIQRQVKGATFREITLSRLRELPVRLPSLRSQDKFASMIKSIDDQSSTLATSFGELDSLFTSLQHRAFRGEL